jgi:hypothetical protein
MFVVEIHGRNIHLHRARVCHAPAGEIIVSIVEAAYWSLEVIKRASAPDSGPKDIHAAAVLLPMRPSCKGRGYTCINNDGGGDDGRR